MAKTDVAPVRGALVRIRSMLNEQRPADAKVAYAILADPLRVTTLSVTELASEAQVAVSTVVRACQRLGFEGYQDLKYAVARDAAADRGPLVPRDLDGASTAELLPLVVATATATLAESLHTVDATTLGRLAAALAGARQVVVVGLGPSAAIALDAGYRLNQVGVPTATPQDVMAQKIAAGGLRQGDVLVVVSHTGATKETLHCVERAKEEGALTSAITSFATSPLTRAADVALIAGSWDVSYRVEAMSARLAHICVVDALCCAVSLLDPAKTEAAYANARRALTDHQL